MGEIDFDSPITCSICEVQLTDEHDFFIHQASKEHKFMYLKHYYTLNKPKMITNKHGVAISAVDPRDNNNNELPSYVRVETGKFVMYLRKDCTGDMKIYVKNGSKKVKMLRNIQFLYYCNRILVTDKYDVSKGEKQLKLNPGAVYEVDFSAVPGPPCVQELPVFFEFTNEDDLQPFYVLRILAVEVLDEVSEALLPVEEYERVESKTHMQQPPLPHEFIPGVPPKIYEHVKRSLAFQHYYPDWLRILMDCKFKFDDTPSYLKEKCVYVKDLMRQRLNLYNYREWFETHLWIEEIQRENDLMKFHMTNYTATILDDVRFPNVGKIIALDVPGLAEKRPCVMVGDSVFFRPAGKLNPIYEGIAHRIVEETVHLGFSEEFWEFFKDSQEVDVQFWFNRTTYIRAHAALQKYDLVTNVLFPNPSTKNISFKHKNFNFFDERISKNEEQKLAVKMIVNEVSAPSPYILFGPPGTGKTLTIVEAIKQIFFKEGQSQILISGPSNSACDLITSRLLVDISEDHILRINAQSRSVISIPKDVRRVCRIENNTVVFPSEDEIGTYRIIITTFVTACKVLPKFDSKDFNASFTHIFLDECAHGLEPEALIPLLGCGRMVILTGDPKQLGPVVSSKYCLKGSTNLKIDGLDQSLMERLMNRDPYKPDAAGKFNNRFVTKLLNNFRSHKDILEVPNKLFYQSQLRPMADKKTVNSMLRSHILPNPNVPLIFDGVNGRDNRQEKNPSFFNTHEVSRVLHYIKELRYVVHVDPHDIGIVAPYRTQIKKIREGLQMKYKGWSEHIRVGSPEEFQGDERRVIIVSTVRASAEHLLHDDYQQLGFLRNPKRFNVAVTRAQALLIVVGCPYLLVRDVHWGALLQFAKDKNCYTGCKFEALTKREVDGVYHAYREIGIDLDDRASMDNEP